MRRSIHRHRPSLLAVLLGGLIAFGAAPIAAWNDAGHMTAALIAYDRLPIDVRVAAGRLLRMHPRFHADFEPTLPASLARANAAQQDRWFFAYAATWPDAARRFEREPDVAERDALVARYNHGSWHYINLPTYLRAADAAALHVSTPSMRWSADLADANLNLVQALARLTEQWCSPGQTDEDRALSLSWLEHLIADVHQPLHATALYAVPLYPNGDRGGNDVAVSGGTNLHALWDGALGSDVRLHRIDTMARDFGGVEAGDPGADLDGAFEHWAKQSRDLAARVVYTDQVRSAISMATPEQPPRVRLDADYRAELRATAQRQIGLAGQRIAWVTQRLLARGDCGR